MGMGLKLWIDLTVVLHIYLLFIDGNAVAESTRLDRKKDNSDQDNSRNESTILSSQDSNVSQSQEPPNKKLKVKMNFSKA